MLKTDGYNIAHSYQHSLFLAQDHHACHLYICVSKEKCNYPGKSFGCVPNNLCHGHRKVKCSAFSFGATVWY